MRLHTILLGLLLSAASVMAADLSLRVVPLTGNAKQEALAAIGKVVYHGDSIYVIDQLGVALYQEALDKVQHVEYTTADIPTPGTSNDAQQELSVSIYPNPTLGQLSIVNAKGTDVRIYDLSGRLVQTSTLTEGATTVDVSSFSAGTYILLVQNDAFQFIKQ